MWLRFLLIPDGDTPTYHPRSFLLLSGARELQAVNYLEHETFLKPRL